MRDLKAKVVPLKFREINEREEGEYRCQLDRLAEIYGDTMELLDTVIAGKKIPACDAVIFPQLIGAAYQYRQAIIDYQKPVIVITSQFGTVDMWDWELVSYFKNAGITVFSPYNTVLGKVIFRAMAVKRDLQGAKFIMFQDDPGEGMQAYIFKRFYWWQEECTEAIKKVFGAQIFYKSWKEVNKRAERMDEADALREFESWDISNEGISDRQKVLVGQLYLAVKETIDEIGNVCGIGANCLNESMYCKTTPCLVWNMLFEKHDIIWCCEGDTLTLLSTYILYHSLKTPIMMTNIYPFLVGKAAIYHEKIADFPEVDNKKNYALGVHCGYAGFAPRPFCTKWKMVPKVLEIVNENAYMIDCELPVGDMILAKINPSFDCVTVVPGKIEKYVQFPGTDSRNASLLHYSQGEKVMEELPSHHQMILTGDQKAAVGQIARVFGWKYKVIE